jgi:cell filamentation protein
LAEREAGLTAVRLAELERRFIPGDYDVDHLQAVHHKIFWDLYPWAGELRTVKIAKGESMFALPQHVASYLAGVLSELAKEDYLRGLEREEFVARLAHYYAELNAVHPFREATVVPSARSSVRSQPKRGTPSTGPAWTPTATYRPRAKAIAARTSN